MATRRTQFQAELRNSNMNVISTNTAFSIRAPLPLAFMLTQDYDKGLRTA